MFTCCSLSRVIIIMTLFNLHKLKGILRELNTKDFEKNIKFQMKFLNNLDPFLKKFQITRLMSIHCWFSNICKQMLAKKIICKTYFEQIESVSKNICWKLINQIWKHKTENFNALNMFTCLHCSENTSSISKQARKTKANHVSYFKWDKKTINCS
jgi:hypothetical protein